MSEFLGVMTRDNDLFDELATDSEMRKCFVKAQTLYINQCFNTLGYMTIERMKAAFHLPIDPYNDSMAIYKTPDSYIRFDLVPLFNKDIIDGIMIEYYYTVPID